jgi:hypothetical protein
MPQPAKKQIPQAATNGIANEQRTRQHGNCDGHTSDDGQIGSPVVEKAFPNKSGRSHVIRKGHKEVRSWMREMLAPAFW